MASQNPGDGGDEQSPPPAPPFPARPTYLSFSHDASCLIAADEASVQWRCCETFKLRGLYEESGATAAAGDMRDRNQSTCAVVRRAGAGFEVRRFRPGSLNYSSRYDSVRIGGGDDDDDVRSVHVHGDRTVVVHAGRVDVFGLDDGRRKAAVLQRRVETGDNRAGACAVSRGPPGSPFAFACPGVNDGNLRVERWVGGFTPLVIGAHRWRVASVAMSWGAKLVATASVKGTIVRVFRVADGELLQEVRLAAAPAAEATAKKSKPHKTETKSLTKFRACVKYFSILFL